MKEPETVTLLLIDDDDVDIRAVQRGFRKHRISNPIVVAHDGQEGLDVLRGANGRERLPRPFVILLDLKMPVMNGQEFLDTIREDPELRTSIVFILTTSDDDRDKLRAYESQIAGYVVKSDVGKDFLNFVSMLEKFIITIQFPPDET